MSKKECARSKPIQSKQVGMSRAAGGFVCVRGIILIRPASAYEDLDEVLQSRIRQSQ